MRLTIWVGNLEDEEVVSWCATWMGSWSPGVYGVGKSSLVEEMAEVLEGAGMSFAAIDLDWLWWFSALDVMGAGLRRGGGQRSSDPGRGRRRPWRGWDGWSLGRSRTVAGRGGWRRACGRALGLFWCVAPDATMVGGVERMIGGGWCWFAELGIAD
ncbi:MAG: hypothetical protein U9N84_05890 [Actinomycetota bacterium]|nr:hypothetical protein [Actinomycetota bacterium]